jgi:hypothetical protein
VDLKVFLNLALDEVKDKQPARSLELGQESVDFFTQAIDLLMSIETSVTRQLGRIDPVSADYRSGRLLIAAAFLILRFGQGCLGLSSGSVFGPLAIVVVVIYRFQQRDIPS